MWNAFQVSDTIYWILREQRKIISLHNSFPHVKQMKKDVYFKDSWEV